MPSLPHIHTHAPAEQGLLIWPPPTHQRVRLIYERVLVHGEQQTKALEAQLMVVCGLCITLCNECICSRRGELPPQLHRMAGCAWGTRRVSESQSRQCDATSLCRQTALPALQFQSSGVHSRHRGEVCVTLQTEAHITFARLTRWCSLLSFAWRSSWRQPTRSRSRGGKQGLCSRFLEARLVFSDRSAHSALRRRCHARRTRVPSSSAGEGQADQN